MNDTDWTKAPGIMFWGSGEPIIWIRAEVGDYYWRHLGDSGETCKVSRESAATAWIDDPGLVPLNQTFVDEYLRYPAIAW